MFGCRDNPIWPVILPAAISPQGISWVITWPPAFHPLQQDHCLQALNSLRSHQDLAALSHYAPSWAKASAGCKSAEHCKPALDIAELLQPCGRAVVSWPLPLIGHYCISAQLRIRARSVGHVILPALPVPGPNTHPLTSGMGTGCPRYLCSTGCPQYLCLRRVAHTLASSS